MKRYPTSSVRFMPNDELLINPYMGFSTFQHFRGGKLFDADTDGWKKEFYPLFPGVGENGADEGFHPDASIAYIRVCWKDFEPREGIFNYAMIDELLSTAAAHGQSLMLRLMPHTTRPNQDIPDWLAERIPHPERPETARVKESPDDPEFFYAFARAVQALGARYDGHPLLCSVDLSLTGAWGEGHNLDFVPETLQHVLIDAFTGSFHKTTVICPVAGSRLIPYANLTRPVGMRADCLGDMRYHMYYYPRVIAGFPDLWKEAPMSFESCWTVQHWYEQGWDIDYIIEQSLKWHISHFNAKSSPCPRVWEKQIERWQKKMGYRFAVRLLDFPGDAAAGDTLDMGMWLENRGVAPIYRDLPFRLRLKNQRGAWVLDTGLDIRNWLPGDSFENFTVTLPGDIPTGAYALEASIGEGSPECPSVYMAMDAPQEAGWYRLAELNIL